MAHTAVRPATTWGPAALNTYCLYMVGTVMAGFVLDDKFCFILEALGHAVIQRRLLFITNIIHQQSCLSVGQFNAKKQKKKFNLSWMYNSAYWFSKTVLNNKMTAEKHKLLKCFKEFLLLSKSFFFLNRSLSVCLHLLIPQL